MDPTIDPNQLGAAAAPAAFGGYLAALPHPPMDHGHGPAKSVRTAEYEGHRISVTTTYEITVDGRPLTAGLDVDDSGMLSCHGLPAYQFVSAVDAVKVLIHTYPDSFRGGD
ncbi:hypothetical protein [Kitasatospora sp. NPDC001547]|uniref:hypothetical protein n=1 Tax=Kitasatospora sp. NPDC001547 TaxID=3364015 RepID=UPI0036BF16F5|nr:hypothetical protein KitaXyl93_63860 [Kitasatospora sp. Xyl93]